MNAPRIDHIGIVVDDLEASVASMARMLPGAAIVRRSIPDAGLEVAEFAAANVIVELLRYTDRGDGFGRAVMGSAPGVNHLSLSVADLDAALGQLRAEGIEPAAGFPRRGAHGRVAFLPRDANTGLLFELCEPDDAAAHDCGAAQRDAATRRQSDQR